MVTHEDGDREIIVTGARSNRVQIYNIATDTWRIGGSVFQAIFVLFLCIFVQTGNPFPRTEVLWYNTNHVKLGNTLIAIGGYDYSMPSGPDRQ